MSFDALSGEMTKSRTSDESSKNEKKKRSILTSIFSKKGKNKRGCDGDFAPGAEILFDLEGSHISRRNFLETSPGVRKSSSGNSRIEGLNLSVLERQRRKPAPQVQDYKIYVGTWNVGGRCPNSSINLEDFLQVEGSSDIYVLGFQEIVPLNAGNVLVIEDNEPAAKWLALIGQALNKPRDVDDFAVNNDPSSRCSKAADSKSPGSSSNFFQRPSLKVLSKDYRANTALVKSCNCRPELAGVRRRARKLSDLLEGFDDDDDLYGESPHLVSSEAARGGGGDDSYCLVASKQMVGIFLSVWVRSELVRHVRHVRMATVGRGIMGCLGNKGCIALSMSVHWTSFSFVCSHLTSGEKEGDELKRNADVAEILRSTQFPRICKYPGSRVPEKITDHDRIVWFGDLNYRIALSYQEAITLLEDNDWDTLLGRDQLVLEREAGRVFYGWKEGKIYFAPTYKYTQNSDVYAGETTKSKKKRRTPSWCDRILWYGNGIEQLEYVRGESRFSDHRPVCAVFKVQVELPSANASNIVGRCYRKGFSNVSSSKVPFVDVLSKRHSFYEY